MWFEENTFSENDVYTTDFDGQQQYKEEEEEGKNNKHFDPDLILIL